MNFADNPFFLLDASPRDSKSALHEKSENKSFDLDEETCRNAERILLNPKKRLEAEISWFPGISPRKTKELFAQIKVAAQDGNYNSSFFLDLDNLVRANALALFISDVSVKSLNKEYIKRIVEDFCIATSDFDKEEILSSINEDRTAAGFSKIIDDDTLEQELKNTYHLYKQILHAFLDQLDSGMIVEILTALIEEITETGEAECKWWLLDSIISDYEVDVCSFFEKQEEQIDADINEITRLIEEDPSSESLPACVDKLENDVLLWDKIAQPIQVLYKSKGLEHKRSSSLAQKVRDLAVAIYNNHELTDLSERISRLLLGVFAEVPLVAETISDDLKFLTTSAKDKKKIESIKKITQRYDIVPTSSYAAKEKVRHCLDEVMPIINDLCDIETGKNYLASFLLHYVIEYANKQHDFETCIEILEKVRPLINDDELLERFYENELIIRQNLNVKKAQEQVFWDCVKLYAIITVVFGIIGAFIGGCDRHGDAGSGFAGGLFLGIIISIIGILQNFTRRR